MSAEDIVTEIEDNVELPDDFFDEFEDSKFLDEIVEIVAPETRAVRTDVGTDSNDTNKSNNDQPTDDEPLLRRCLDGINSLTKSIERRKRRLREEISVSENKRSKEHRSRSPSHDSRDRNSPSTSRADRNVRSRDRRSPPRRSPSRRSNGRSRARSRSRERNRSRDRRGSRNRRDRSRSDTPARGATMSFLEELEQKFAEKGQDFPEKELLLRDKANGTLGINPYSVAVAFPQQCEVPIRMPPYMQMPMSMYNQPYLPQWNGNYIIDPMTAMPHVLRHIPPPLPPAIESNMIQNTSKTIDKNPSTKAEVVAKCRDASKILRCEENKVPKLRFLFTRTSMPMDPSEEQTPPLQSRKNVEFEQTSDNQKAFAPLKFLPPRTRELVKLLGYDCSIILNRLRLKEFADKVVNEIEDIDARSKRTKDRSYNECGIQTESSYKCPNCINRETKTYFNKFIQTDATKKVSIRTQTNEKDYREPLLRSLSRMTPGQLVAVSDFADLICEPRPTTSAEIFAIRERLMDIFNLSERGTEAIEAERGEQDMRRRSMISPPLEDLRNTLRGSSDHRIPPPPPLLLNYHMDMLAAEEEERIQQMRFEENRRHLEEQERNREWEHQLIQQRLQEEEMRNDRRNGFGRGANHWNGGGGRGRY